MDITFKENFGSYAVVIGASEGIGKAFAKELATRGLNLVLVARWLDKLEILSKDLISQFKVNVRCISLDLAQDGAADLLFQKTEDLNIGLLVLNAAVVTAGAFVKNSFEQESSLIKFNTIMPAQIAHRFGKRMIDQKRGGILFVSSLAGESPTPFQSTYSATKAYISSLGQSLSYELAPYGVDVSVIAPGMTDTEGLKTVANIDYSKFKGVTLLSPEDVAIAGLNGLGKQIFIIPGFKNKLAVFIMGLLSKSGVVNMVGKMTREAVDANAR